MSTRLDHALGLGFVMVLSACASPPGPDPVAAAETDDVREALALSPRTEELAEQAQRDVEQLRGIETGQAEVSGPAPEPARRRAEIDWVIPAARREAAAGPDAPGAGTATDGPRSTPAGGQQTLGRDLPPGSALPPEEPGGGVPLPAPETDESDRLRRLVVDLSSELYRRGAYSDMPLRELLLIAATTLVTPDRALATDALPGVTERERELLAQMQSFFSRVGVKLVETGDPEVLVTELEALNRALAREPRLVVAQASLCTRVGGFGDYDEFPRNAEGHYAFLAHTGQQAVVYVEIEDFSSELNDNGQWVTELSQQLVVISERDGIPVWREDWQAGVDQSRKRREDFFIVQVVTLPERLSVGRYNLKIRIRDDRSGAEAEAAIDFEMVADPRLAGGS